MPPAPRRKNTGALTEPQLPPRTIYQGYGITIEQFYSSQGDHAPRTCTSPARRGTIRHGSAKTATRWNTTRR
jgi:hypothetical protein